MKKFIFIFLVLSAPLFGSIGWEKATNLSGIRTNLYCHNPVISSSEKILAVAWEEKEKGVTRLILSFGESEKNLQNLTLYTCQEEYNLQPDIIVLNDFILLTYSGPDGEIYFMRGKENGKLWSLSRRITFTPEISLEPKFFYDEKTKTLFLYFIEEREGDYFLKYVSSFNHGATWSQPEILLTSEQTGSAIFFPSLFTSEGRFYVVYQGREEFKTEKTTKDKLYLAMLDRKTKEIIQNRSLLEAKENIRYTPIAGKDKKSLIWGEYEKDIWNIYIGIMEEYEKIFPLKVNIENKNCYNRSVLFVKDYIKIFWSMVDKTNSQIFSRKYVFQSGVLEEKAVVVETPFNSYLSGTTVFQQAEYIAWQEEYNNSKSAIFIQRSDTSVEPPVITKPDQDKWFSTVDIKIEWEEPPDPSGISGYGYEMSREAKPSRIIQNLPPEINSLSAKHILNEGTNYFHLKAFDRAGNESTTATKMIKVDMTSPVITRIFSPTHPENTFVTNPDAVVYIEAADNLQPIRGFAYTVDYGKGALKDKTINLRTNELQLHLEPGISYLRIWAIDESGDSSLESVYPFYISKREPEMIAVTFNTQVVTNQQIIAEPVTNIPDDISDEKKKVIINAYLKKRYKIVAKPIFNAKTIDVIGPPENVEIEEVVHEGIKLKRVKFDIYVSSSGSETDDLAEKLYIWTPVLNFCRVPSEDPFVPLFVIRKNRSFKGKNKDYRYFKVDITLWPEEDYMVILTARKKIMASSLIRGRRKIKIKTIPHSLRWMLYE
ncbi:MAG: exo-alpha-sialidase [Spirochaetes bacterium]|nr:exo-alpha-sialidase [Spirochaetota bacterium]